MADTLVSEQFRQQLQRRAFVVTLLDQGVQHLAFGTPAVTRSSAPRPF
jgi:hypothetical protein